MKKYKVGVKILPREVILDTQGRAVEQMLKHHDFKVSSCRIGRYIELIFEQNREQAMLEARKVADFALANPLIENYELIAIGEVE